MQDIIVSGGQTLLDIAMQYSGDADRAYEIAELNGVSISDDLEPGTSLKVPEPEIDKMHIAEVFETKGLYPASSDVAIGEEELEGIDYWAIEDDFIVQPN